MSRRYVGNSPKKLLVGSSCTVTKTSFLRYCVYTLYVSSRQPAESLKLQPDFASYDTRTRLLYTLLPIITMDQFSLKPTNRPNKPVLYSYNICAVPRRLELENGINRRPNQNQASVSSTTTTTVYHLYQFSPIFWHYFIGLK